VDRKDGRSRTDRHQEILEVLQRAGAQLIVCAGFNEVLIPDLTAAYPYRIINTHNSLLPAFGGGLHAIRDALEYGAKVTGCTVHFVTDDLDNGPILVQRSVSVHEDDTEESLATRVLAEEYQALPEAIRLIAAGRVTVDGRRVRIAPAPVAAAS
jgi:phosphoribosylglycinamide formyltransferase-1